MMASAEGVLAAAEAAEAGQVARRAGRRHAPRRWRRAPRRWRAVLRDGEALGLLGHFPVPGRAFGTPAFKELAAEAAEEYCACMAEARFGRAVPLLSDALAARRAGACRLPAPQARGGRARQRRFAGGDGAGLRAPTRPGRRLRRPLPAGHGGRVPGHRPAAGGHDQAHGGPRLRAFVHGGRRAAEHLPLPWRRRFRVSPPRRRDADRRTPTGSSCCPTTSAAMPTCWRSWTASSSSPRRSASSFMSLAPARDESRVARPFLGTGPRIDVQMVTRPHRGVPARARPAAWPRRA